MTDDSLDRRSFGKHVVAAGALASLARGPSPKNAAAEEKKKPKDDSRAEVKEMPKTPADLLLEVLKQRYPDERLDEATLKSIRRELSVGLLRSRLLSNYPLRNSDEPGFVFAAYRGDDE